MYELAKKVVFNLPYIKRIRGENETLRNERIKWKAWVPPGHFYSPIPDISQIKNDDAVIFREGFASLEGIDINESSQLKTLSKFSEF